MSKRFLFAAVLSAASMGALADDVFFYPLEKQVELKNGQTLYVYKDGKTAVVDRWGRPVQIKAGAQVESKEGQKIALQGNEAYRLHVEDPG